MIEYDVENWQVTASGLGVRFRQSILLRRDRVRDNCEGFDTSYEVEELPLVEEEVISDE